MITADDTVDLLADLAHDLGKYLRLPLAWLPAEADEAAVREAAREALLETRRRGGEVTPASALWASFLGEVGENLNHFNGWPALVATVERALSWADRLEGPLDRAALTADLAAVAPAIRALLDAVDRHGEPS